MTQTRILLLSGGSLVGQNVAASLAHRRASIHLAAASSTADEPILYDCDSVYLTPEVRRDPQAYTARFRDVLENCAPDLVIPCRDDDVSFLATEREAVPAMARRFLCGNAAVAEAMLDKLESARFSRRHGLPFAPTLAVSGDVDAAQRFAARNGWPIIAKPRQGYGSRGVRFILDSAQLARVCVQPDLVLQRYCGDAQAVRRFANETAERGLPLFHSLEDTKVSIQASIAPDGKVTAVFASGNTMRFGRSERVQRIDDPALLDNGRRWAAAFAGAGWRGPVNIQCHRDGDVITIYEYNGRFTGATAARRLLGFDEVGMALRDWLDLQLPDAAPAPASEVIRYPVGRTVVPAQAEQLRRDGHWAAPEALRTTRAGEP
jgi:hypothetical protein